MQLLTLHHYGFLTGDTQAWLNENELLMGKPFKIYDRISISSQQVNITFVQQEAGSTLTELVEPWEGNSKLQQWLTRGITVYHTGYLAPEGEFESSVHSLEEKGAHALPPFYSEAFGNKRCVFLVTRHLGMIEVIEQ
ncbi:MAG: hypothetical protein IPP72_14360 [Chitinophagaceae bacterium]|nr:hypothetical protein [Chitinophagaceae bacterium]